MFVFDGVCPNKPGFHGLEVDWSETFEYSQPHLGLTAVFSVWHSLCGAGNSFRDVMLLHRSLRNSPSHSLVEVGGDL